MLRLSTNPRIPVRREKERLVVARCFALALAVLFDTTVILLVLLPALMGLAGKHLWYLPSWLNWLPGGPKQPQEPVSAQPAVATADDSDD